MSLGQIDEAYDAIEDFDVSVEALGKQIQKCVAWLKQAIEPQLALLAAAKKNVAEAIKAKAMTSIPGSAKMDGAEEAEEKLAKAEEGSKELGEATKSYSSLMALFSKLIKLKKDIILARRVQSDADSSLASAEAEMNALQAACDISDEEGKKVLQPQFDKARENAEKLKKKRDENKEKLKKLEEEYKEAHEEWKKQTLSFRAKIGVAVKKIKEGLTAAASWLHQMINCQEMEFFKKVLKRTLSDPLTGITRRKFGDNLVADPELDGFLSRVGAAHITWQRDSDKCIYRDQEWIEQHIVGYVFDVAKLPKVTTKEAEITPQLYLVINDRADTARRGETALGDGWKCYAEASYEEDKIPRSVGDVVIVMLEPQKKRFIEVRIKRTIVDVVDQLEQLGTIIDVVDQALTTLGELFDLLANPKAILFNYVQTAVERAVMLLHLSEKIVDVRSELNDLRQSIVDLDCNIDILESLPYKDEKNLKSLIELRDELLEKLEEKSKELEALEAEYEKQVGTMAEAYAKDREASKDASSKMSALDKLLSWIKRKMEGIQKMLNSMVDGVLDFMKAKGLTERLKKVGKKLKNALQIGLKGIKEQILMVTSVAAGLSQYVSELDRSINRLKKSAFPLLKDIYKNVVIHRYLAKAKAKWLKRWFDDAEGVGKEKGKKDSKWKTWAEKMKKKKEEIHKRVDQFNEVMNMYLEIIKKIEALAVLVQKKIAQAINTLNEAVNILMAPVKTMSAIFDTVGQIAKGGSPSRILALVAKLVSQGSTLISNTQKINETFIGETEDAKKKEEKKQEEQKKEDEEVAEETESLLEDLRETADAVNMMLRDLTGTLQEIAETYKAILNFPKALKSAFDRALGGITARIAKLVKKATDAISQLQKVGSVPDMIETAEVIGAALYTYQKEKRDIIAKYEDRGEMDNSYEFQGLVANFDHFTSHAPDAEKRLKVAQSKRGRLSQKVKDSLAINKKNEEKEEEVSLSEMPKLLTECITQVNRALTELGKIAQTIQSVISSLMSNWKSIAINTVLDALREVGLQPSVEILTEFAKKYDLVYYDGVMWRKAKSRKPV